MKKWKVQSIKSITVNLDSKRIPLNSTQRSKKEKQKLYPYIGANNIMGYIDEYIFDQKILCIAEDGGSWGRNETCAKIYNEKVWVNNHAHVLTAKENLSLEFLKYYLNWQDLNLYITGATRGKLTKSALNNIQIPLPPLAEQKRIAAILDAADLHRQKTNQLITKYDDLSQSLFLDMFGDPVTNPKGWEVTKFKDVGKLDRGKSKHRPRNAPELLGGVHPLIQTGDISNSGIFLNSYKSTYSEIGLAQSKKWKKGTLCITIAANIAKTAILKFEACFPDSVVGFIPNEKTNNIYTLFWLGFLQKILEDSAPESAQKNINLDILRKLDFMLPAKELQENFSNKIEIIEAQKAQAEASLQRAEDLFQSLLQKAFKGEL